MLGFFVIAQITWFCQVKEEFPATLSLRMLTLLLAQIWIDLIIVVKKSPSIKNLPNRFFCQNVTVCTFCYFCDK